MQFRGRNSDVAASFFPPLKLGLETIGCSRYVLEVEWSPSSSGPGRWPLTAGNRGSSPLGDATQRYRMLQNATEPNRTEQNRTEPNETKCQTPPNATEPLERPIDCTWVAGILVDLPLFFSPVLLSKAKLEY